MLLDLFSLRKVLTYFPYISDHWIFDEPYCEGTNLAAEVIPRAFAITVVQRGTEHTDGDGEIRCLG